MKYVFEKKKHQKKPLVSVNYFEGSVFGYMPKSEVLFVCFQVKGNKTETSVRPMCYE